MGTSQKRQCMVPSRVFLSVFSQCTCVCVGAVAADEDWDAVEVVAHVVQLCSFCVCRHCGNE